MSMCKRIYINDFCENLNYRGIILYIGNVNPDNLRKALERDAVNKLWRFDSALTVDDLSKKNFIYIENCDLQNLDYPIHEYVDDYDICALHEDDVGKYYILDKRNWLR